MPEFKGTPGPWVGKNKQGKYMMDHPWGVIHDDDHNTCCAPIVAGKRVVALVVNDDTKRPLDKHHDEMTANGYLVASAPELLQALQTLVARIDYYASLPDRGEVNIEDWAYTAGSDDMNAARSAIAKALGQ